MLTMRPSSDFSSSFALGLVLLATGCIVGLAYGNTAMAQDGREILRASVLVPRAVGTALAGGRIDGAKVRFTRPVKADPSLTKSGFSLERVNTSVYASNHLDGGLTFVDTLGRRVHQALAVDYKAVGQGRYEVGKTVITPVTPVVPSHEIHILPAETMSLKRMQALGFVELLDFARKHRVWVGPDTLDDGPREYQVLVFAMDRLQPGDGWVLFSDTTQGATWGKDGWMVAGTTATFAVNGPEESVFRVYYAPGTKNPWSGKVLTVCAFTNHHAPPMPPGPSDQVEIPDALRDLKARYEAKAIPGLN